MNNLPQHLQQNEKEAIESVTKQLFQFLEGNLAEVYLFGSKARGDFHADSDIDLLVIVECLDHESRWRIRATAADRSLEFDVLFNTHILDKARWNRLVEFQDTLWREVQRDGIALQDFAPQPAS